MIRCAINDTADRRSLGGMRFPLGVYPIEPMTPRQGYSVDFEPGDGGDDGVDDPEWERWPDRYLFDIVVSHERLDAVVGLLLAMLPGRAFPILDFLGHDAFREVDPYIAYELCGVDRILDGYRRFRGFFLEDGMVGFGAMSEDPFFYFFLDEHKIIQVRCEPETRRRVERVLEAFDLEEVPDPAGADAAAHEHRNVILAPDDQPDLLSSEEIVEHLRDRWRLTLNVDPETNLDDEGREIGVCGWRCLVRCAPEEESQELRYCELLLRASCLRDAEDLALEHADGMLTPDRGQWPDVMVVSADRADEAGFASMIATASADKSIDIKNLKPEETGVLAARWLS